MEFFSVLPMQKHLDKQIAIHDSESLQVGFIRRKYRSFGDKILNYLPLPLTFLETINIDGANSDYHLKIREQSFKSTLIKLKWDIFLKDAEKENKFLLEDKTKISTNPRMVYHKNNNEYVFKKDIFNRTCEVSLNDITCATIRMDKKIPPSIRAIREDNALTIIELLGIYYIISLVY